MYRNCDEHPKIKEILHFGEEKEENIAKCKRKEDLVIYADLQSAELLSVDTVQIEEIYQGVLD